jgi:hypothetical protein
VRLLKFDFQPGALADDRFRLFLRHSGGVPYEFGPGEAVGAGRQYLHHYDVADGAASLQMDRLKPGRFADQLPRLLALPLQQDGSAAADASLVEGDLLLVEQRLQRGGRARPRLYLNEKAWA